MKENKIIDVCEKYSKKLKKFHQADKKVYHIKWMIMKISEFIKENQQEKANRWLGFIQGVLWAMEIYTVDEMREHNRE